MQHCFADNMVDRKLYIMVIVIGGIPCEKLILTLVIILPFEKLNSEKFYD